MGVLTPEQLAALRQRIADGYTVTWSKPQANAAFQAIEDWFEANSISQRDAIEAAVPCLFNVAEKERLVAAFIEQKATEMPRRRLAPDYYDDWREVLAELEAQTDRGVAIVGAALLDAKIEKALRMAFVPGLSKRELGDLFDGPVTPLGSFSAKVRVANALGLVGDRSKADLQLIGQIRNRFAHKLQIRNFDDPDISRLCKKLTLAEMTFGSQEPPVEARARFIQSVVNIMHLLYSELVAGTPVGQKSSKSP